MINSINSPMIHEGTVSNFDNIALGNSNSGPVLVNFWSKKAGPCLRLYPVLDKIIHKYNGLMLLVNVDTDQQIALAKAYNVISVPTLKLFRQEQIVETLFGFKTEAELIQVLDLYVTRKSDPVLKHAIQVYANGQGDEAYQLITDAIQVDPGNPRLHLAICKLLKHENRFSDAISLIESLPGKIRNYYEISNLYPALQFCNDANPEMNIATLKAVIEREPKNLEAKRQLAIYCAINHDHEQALNLLDSIRQKDMRYKDNYVQKAMLRLFKLLGPDHKLTKTYKSKLKCYTY